MKQVLNSLVLAAAVVATSFNVSAAGELDKLLEQVKKDRISEGQLNKKREKENLKTKKLVAIVYKSNMLKTKSL
jgi:biopolymer transport protein ExbB